jgi:hypothetical protein
MSLEPQGCPAPGACACLTENANLIWIIAGIRQKSGVGDKPDLAALPEAIAEKITEARRAALEEAAKIAAKQARWDDPCECGAVDPDTGQYECRLKDCICFERHETAHSAAAAIRALIANEGGAA